MHPVLQNVRNAASGGGGGAQQQQQQHHPSGGASGHRSYQQQAQQQQQQARSRTRAPSPPRFPAQHAYPTLEAPAVGPEGAEAPQCGLAAGAGLDSRLATKWL